MKREKILEIVFIVIIFIILFIFVINTPLIYRYKNNGKLIINEVMASNKTTIVDNNTDYNDYIEIYNGYDYDINLLGYYLSDDNFNLRKYIFPDVTIKSNDYLVVFADGNDKVDNNIIHTNFKLDNKGEVLTLSDNKLNVLSKIYFNNTKSDTSYGYNGSEYVYFYLGTPGRENSLNYSYEPIVDKNSDVNLKITEYSKGDNSLIEIYNDSNKDIDMEGYYISNDSNNLYKYIFSSVIIKSKDYLVIDCDGNNNVEEDKIHTNFKLDYDDKVLILSDNKKNLIDKLYLTQLGSNYSYGLYKGKWFLYKDSSFGKENFDNFIEDNTSKSKIIRINEVSLDNVEIKNLVNEDIDLDNYQIVLKNGKIFDLSGKSISGNGYLVFNDNDFKFGIDNGGNILYLYHNGKKVDEYEVGKLSGGISSGINNDDKRVYYLSNTMGRDNDGTEYLGYSLEPIFNINGGYVEEGTKISIKSNDDSQIYYTLDGSFPSDNSKKYDGEISVSDTTVVKAIAYKDGYINSDIVSRTFIVGRKHDVGVVSISSDYNNLFGYSGIISNYYRNDLKKINFELYEDGKLATSFIGDSKISGMDSRLKPQKSMSIYLRKDYGIKEITYPLFDNFENNTYSSFLLRNAGEDPKNIRIMDAVLTKALDGEMDLDYQGYKPVVVYINGEYYGLYNLRDKLNSDYVKTKFGVNKDDIDLIKYMTANNGSTWEYNDIVNYIYNHDMSVTEYYEYVKTKIDVEELCNYWIVESYYGNTDLGNIKYWKSSDGKFRWMLYDLDWSMWSSTVNMSFPVIYRDIPAVTYVDSSINITRRLYNNSEFREMYLSSLAKYLKNTFNPQRMNKIVDELAGEIESEMPYHIDRWNSGSMNSWHNNLDSFKDMITNRYNYVVNNLQREFNLSDDEYDKYFKEL